MKNGLNASLQAISVCEAALVEGIDASEQLRLRVGQQLVAAAEDGRLGDVLGRQSGLERLESARQSTATKLLAAAEDGSMLGGLGAGAAAGEGGCAVAGGGGGWQVE